jgi:hypothetical protein
MVLCTNTMSPCGRRHPLPLRSGGETWGPVSPDNVHESGASPGGQSGSPIVAADGPAGWAISKKRPGHGPSPRFLCPTRPRFIFRGLLDRPLPQPTSGTGAPPRPPRCFRAPRCGAPSVRPGSGGSWDTMTESSRAAARNLLKTRTPPGRAAGVGPRPPSNVCGCPQVPSSPAPNGRREVRPSTQLVGALFAYAENLGDVNDSKERPLRHSP